MNGAQELANLSRLGDCSVMPYMQRWQRVARIVTVTVRRCRIESQAARADGVPKHTVESVEQPVRGFNPIAPDQATDGLPDVVDCDGLDWTISPLPERMRSLRLVRLVCLEVQEPLGFLDRGR